MGHMNPVPVPLEGSRERLSLIQMILLTHLKAGFGKRLIAVARLVGDDGLTALALNIGALAQPPKPPLHVRVEAADNSLVRR